MKRTTKNMFIAMAIAIGVFLAVGSYGFFFVLMPIVQRHHLSHAMSITGRVLMFDAANEAEENHLEMRFFPETMSDNAAQGSGCISCRKSFTYAPTFNGKRLQINGEGLEINGERLQINGEPNRIVLWSECDHLDGHRYILRQNLAVDYVDGFDIDWKNRMLKPNAATSKW